MDLSELIEAYKRQVEMAFSQNKLSKNCYEHCRYRVPRDHDDLDRIVQEFIHFMIHAEYYITLDRIEKGEEMLSKESDEKKKSEYRKLLNDLYIKLENLRPKGESA